MIAALVVQRRLRARPVAPRAPQPVTPVTPVPPGRKRCRRPQRLDRLETHLGDVVVVAVRQHGASVEVETRRGERVELTRPPDGWLRSRNPHAPGWRSVHEAALPAGADLSTFREGRLWGWLLLLVGGGAIEAEPAWPTSELAWRAGRDRAVALASPDSPL